MLDVCLLGTGGMMPLPRRRLTSLMLRLGGHSLLIDCGEGTQVSLKMLNLHWKRIKYIFISHMHADHVTGLPGLLMLSSQVDRDEPLYIYGPEKLRDYIDANRRLLDMYINYEIRFVPTQPGIILENEDYTVEAVPLLHTKPCMGFIPTGRRKAYYKNPEEDAILMDLDLTDPETLRRLGIEE